jgi:hypothetical protein
VSDSSMVKNKPNRPPNQSFNKDAPVSDTQLLTISHKFGEQGILTGKVNGFEGLEGAKAYCEKNAEDVERML